MKLKVISANQARALRTPRGLSIPLDGDSRCRPAFKVATAWREMEGCLEGGDGGGAPPLKAFDNSLSDMMCDYDVCG